MMRIISLLIIVALIVLCAPMASGIMTYSMWLSAHPQAIVADGHSETTISAEVHDANGNPVSDGTTVVFTTGLGIIERNVRTVAGVARARLQSSSAVGTAVVSAVAADGRAVAQLRVEFLEPGTELFDESFISVSSKNYLGYDESSKLVDAAGGVEIFSRGLTITADSCQIDAKRNVLKAKADLSGTDITIKRGNKQLLASALYYDFSSMNGVILTPASDGAKRVLFRGRDLFSQPDTEPDKAVKFDFTPVSDSSLFIRSRSLIIRPGEEVKFKQASFYLEGSRVLSVPLHVEPLRGQSSGINRVITYGTDGLKLDLPIYYSLTPDGTGAIRLKHSEPSQWGYATGDAGWQLDLDQEYNRGGNTEGMFSLDRISSKWGVRWNQRQEYNNDSSLYTYVDFPEHRALFANANYSRSFKDYTMSLYSQGNKQQNMNGIYSTNALLQTKPKSLLGGALSYSVSNRVAFNSGVQNSSKIGNEVGMQLYGKPITLGGNNGSINTSLMATQGWGGGFMGTQVYGNAGYNRSLGNIGQMGLNYSYTFANSTGYSSNEHRISLDLNVRPSTRWSASLYLTQGINTGNLSAFADTTYVFAPTWRLHLLGTMQRSTGNLANYSYFDAEYAIAKVIGRQEVRLIWSQQLKRFRVEFSALTF